MTAFDSILPNEIYSTGQILGRVPFGFLGTNTRQPFCHAMMRITPYTVWNPLKMFGHFKFLRRPREKGR